MATAVAKPLPCSSTSSSFLTNGISKSSSLFPANSMGTGPSRSPKRFVLRVQAQARPTWLPGLDPPPYLDGRSGLLFIEMTF